MVDGVTGPVIPTAPCRVGEETRPGQGRVPTQRPLMADITVLENRWKPQHAMTMAVQVNILITFPFVIIMKKKIKKQEYFLSISAFFGF